MQAVKLKRPIHNVVIFGDSYSTFEGHIPEGYHAYYTGTTGTDLTCVEQTWWHRFVTRAGACLVQNNSFSGSTLCYTGRFSREQNLETAFVTRMDALLEDGFFEREQIDTVLIFGGTNDTWLPQTQMGELILDGWTPEDLANAVPAATYLLARLTRALPDGNVIFILNTHLDPKLLEGVKQGCEVFGCSYLALHDIHKLEGHPSVLGMEQISMQLLAACGYCSES